MTSAQIRLHRHARPQAESGVSLFPFLAVLICTLGSLILLLIVVARQGRLAAEHAPLVATEPASEAIEAAREMIAWEIEQLRSSRQATEAQLAQARLELGHLEDHGRRLADEIRQQQSAWEAISRAEAMSASEQESLEAQYARTRAEIAEAEKQLADNRLRAAERKPSYAILPYEGPFGTRRQPIYIDCRSDAVVLEPEGVVLSENDFLGPLGPGNPLDVALRAKREYLVEQQRRAGVAQPEEPYPLLLIRPGGVAAYYAARAAMESWGSEFGYELVDDDWKLAYPAADPALAEAVHQTVYAARRRQQALLAAAPAHYGNGSGDGDVSFVAKHRGGIMRQDGRADDDRTPGTLTGEGGAGAAFSRSARFTAQGANGAPGAASPGAVHQASAAAAGGSPVSSPAGGQATPRLGEWNPSDPHAKPPGTAEASDLPESLAAVRGRNWGLPDAANGSIPITRPIRVDCQADRLLIVPERGLGREEVIAMDGDTVDQIDAFVSSVWSQMELWGIAGKGMYWRPVLELHVSEGGERRAGELESLLAGSGLDVRRAAAVAAGGRR